VKRLRSQSIGLLLLPVIAVVVVMGVLLPAYVIGDLQPAYGHLLLDVFQGQAVNVAGHVQHIFLGQVDNPRAVEGDSITPAARRSLQEAHRDFRLWKLRVFGPTGEIVYSSDEKEIGEVNREKYFHQRVARGEIVRKVVNKQGQSFEHRRVPLDVVEVYVPIMRAGQFLGSLEIYYDISPEWRLLKGLGTESAWILIALASTLVLVTAILGMRAAKAIGQQQHIQNELIAQQGLFRDLFASAGDAIMVTDPERQIRMVNPAFTHITGYTEKEAFGHTPAMLGSERQDEEFDSLMWKTIDERGRWQGEIWNRRKDGGLYPMLLTITRVLGAGGKTSHYVGLGTDISRQKADQATLQQLAYFDPLTSLPNRLLFYDRMDNALRQARRSGSYVALLFIDLDGFKAVNDSAGHDTGDALLTAVGGRLTQALRGEDTVARVGGDEFTVILHRVAHREDARQVAENLGQIIGQPYELPQGRFEIGASIGIAIFPEHGEDVERLLEVADAAMYKAKLAGRNRIVVGGVNA